MRLPGADAVRRLLRLGTTVGAAILVGVALAALGRIERAPYCDPNWSDVVRYAGTHFRAVGSAAVGATVTVAMADLGSPLGTVWANVGDRDACDYELQDGDATVLPAGSEVYALAAYRPTFRVAALGAAGDLVLYQSDWSTVARTGQDLLDVRGRVARMTFQHAGYCDEGMCVDFAPARSTTDRGEIDIAVAMLLAAPVDPALIRRDYADHAPSLYRVSFDLDDGTRAGFWVFGDLGQADNGIVVPAGFEAFATGGYEIWLPGLPGPWERALPADINVPLAVRNHLKLAFTCSVAGLGIAFDVPPQEAVWLVITAPAGRHELVCDPPGVEPDQTVRITLVFEAR